MSFKGDSRPPTYGIFFLESWGAAEMSIGGGPTQKDWQPPFCSSCTEKLSAISPLHPPHLEVEIVLGQQCAY